LAPRHTEVFTDTFVQLVSLRSSDLIAIPSKPQLIPVYEWKDGHNPAGADLMVIAERELIRAFMRAVTELFGPQQMPRVAWTDIKV
jgi:hypothetical protein